MNRDIESCDSMGRDKTKKGHRKDSYNNSRYMETGETERNRKNEDHIGRNGNHKNGWNKNIKGKEKNIIEDKDIRFVNPYNFIPLGAKCIRSKELEDKEVYTGYFNCGLRLLTHLFIPNTSSSKRLIQMKEWEEKKEEIKGYDFFSYDDLSEAEPYEGSAPLPPANPVIPGSEIRGAVRSVYEAAFNGCMSSIDGARDISRRSTEAKNTGFLYKDKETKNWYFKPCSKAKLLVEQMDMGKPIKSRHKDRKRVPRKVYDSWREGQEIWVDIRGNQVVYDYEVVDDSCKDKVKKESDLKQKNFKKGYLHKGEYINRKEYEAVFYEDPNKEAEDKEGFPIPDNEVQLLRLVVSEYQNNKKNQKAKDCGWYSEYKVSEAEITLVYYSKTKEAEGTLVHNSKTKGEHYYLSPACLSKEVFIKKLDTLLKNNGNYQPCNGEELCPACQIFGMMDKSEKPRTYSNGSKVRITDARLINPKINIEELFEQPIVLPELGEPRPGAVEFYTYSPDSIPKKGAAEEGKGYWTYDYKCNYLVKNKRKITERCNLDEKLPKIRGRKYYWHHDVKMEDYKKNDSVSSMKQRIRPMKPDEKRDGNPNPLFQFRVYFEQLSEAQLRQLKWALDFGDKDCAHKLGRAKPLGFGSVQILAEELHVRKIDKNTGRWHLIDIGGEGNLSFESFLQTSVLPVNDMPEALKTMANWKERPENVKYPIGKDEKDSMENKENAAASHQWFTLNKGKDTFRPNFMKVLPEAVEEAAQKADTDKALYKLINKK